MPPNVPTDAYRVYTGPDGRKRLVYIDPTGMPVDLVPDKRVAGLRDGYYTRKLKLIRVSEMPK